MYSLQFALSLTAFVWVFLPTYLPTAAGIGCFVCSSVNKSNQLCEDTFNNTGSFYQSECKAGRKNRVGYFPGTSCIKVTAKLPDSSYSVVVRDCTVDDGDTTSDTEIGRESHCWMVYMVNFNGIDMQGCALACNTDGCNGAHRQLSVSVYLLLVTAIITRLGLITGPS